MAKPGERGIVVRAVGFHFLRNTVEVEIQTTIADESGTAVVTGTAGFPVNLTEFCSGIPGVDLEAIKKRALDLKKK